VPLLLFQAILEPAFVLQATAAENIDKRCLAALKVTVKIFSTLRYGTHHFMLSFLLTFDI